MRLCSLRWIILYKIKQLLYTSILATSPAHFGLIIETIKVQHINKLCDCAAFAESYFANTKVNWQCNTRLFSATLEPCTPPHGANHLQDNVYVCSLSAPVFSIVTRSLKSSCRFKRKWLRYDSLCLLLHFSSVSPSTLSWYVHQHCPTHSYPTFELHFMPSVFSIIPAHFEFINSEVVNRWFRLKCNSPCTVTFAAPRFLQPV